MKTQPQRQRTSWNTKLFLLPFLAASLALYLWSRPFPDPFLAEPIEGVQGLTGKGVAFVCQRGKRPDISEACVFLTHERK